VSKRYGAERVSYRALREHGAAEEQVDAMPKMNKLLMTIPADPGELHGFRRRFRAWLAASELPEDLQDETLIAVHEAMAATIENGPAETRIAIHASIEEQVIAVDITDGPWHPQRDDEAKRLTLMERLFDEVEICPGPSGTTISLRRPL
jgi:anti-sigma regulatory factor (Ser/Thr protein kinase)